MSCGRGSGWSGAWPGSAWSGSAWSGSGWSVGQPGTGGVPRLGGFAADLAGWARCSQLRVGDAERDAAVDALGEHFAAGRLTHEEFDERSSAAWSARTAGELTALFTDLPRPHVTTPTPAPRTVGRRPRRPRFPLLPVVALSVGVALLTDVPFLAVLLLAWVAFVAVVRPALVRRGAVQPTQTSGSRRAVRGTWS